MAIGEKLEELLRIRGKKPGTLATETGISKSTIYSILRRNNEKVSYSVIEAISKNLGVPVEYFFNNDPQMADQIVTDDNAMGGFLTDDEKIVIKKYRSLSVDGRQQLTSYLDYLIFSTHAGEKNDAGAV